MISFLSRSKKRGFFNDQQQRVYQQNYSQMRNNYNNYQQYQQAGFNQVPNSDQLMNNQCGMQKSDPNLHKKHRNRSSCKII